MVEDGGGWRRRDRKAVLGLLVLAAQALDLELGRVAWPVFETGRWLVGSPAVAGTWPPAAAG